MKYNSNNMKKSITLAMIGLTASITFGQNAENLVSNGSFESIDKEPKKLGSIESALGWYSPTGSRADLFTPNKKLPIISVPDNNFGTESAQDGSNYAGIVTYSHNNKVPRSYVSNKLEVPMKKGEKYCVQFYVSMAEASSYASNQIGVNFSKKAFGTEAKESIIDKTHVLDENNKIFNAPFGWDRVCGTFTAEGGEKFITIGNFTSNENTKNMRNKKASNSKVTPIAAAYYYVDNISVTVVDERNTCDCAPADPTAGYSKTVYQKAINIKEDMTPQKKIEALQIYFGFGKTDFTTASEDALNKIVELMKINPTFKLQVNGYSDEAEVQASEDQIFFQEMDSKRVNAVFDYLSKKGINTNRLIASPQGSAEKSAEIVESDEDDIKQAKNRRVEFIVRP
jgi:outer membrane protein OmpA-like peptidoglycan-associated protein